MPAAPSRVALLQRQTVVREQTADDPMAGIRSALFKVTRPTIVLPPELTVPLVPPCPPARPIPETPALAKTSRAGGKPEAPPRSLATTTGEITPPNSIVVPPANTSGDNALAVRELTLQPAGFTPYDRYLGPVRSVIANIPDRGNSIGAACSFMREAHAFRYATRDPYRADPPAVTAARHSGDCKSKALWLYDRLGDPSALYVIGKVAKGAKASHAWVYWRYESRWWILDPTNRAAPIAADSIARDRYVPYYSFGKDGSFRHPATQLLLAQNEFAASNTPAVASHPTKRKTRR